MKKTLPLLFLPFFGFAQTVFTETQIDPASTTVGIRKIVAVDINNDTLPDVAVGCQIASGILNYANLGAPTFGTQQTASTIIGQAFDLVAGDFNADGWQDFVVISQTSISLQYFQNMQNGSFAAPNVLDTAFIHPIKIIAANFNADAYDDVLMVDDTAAYIYFGSQTGTFTKQRVAGNTEFYSAAVADLDGDQDLDILLGSVKLYTLKNNGNGTFVRDSTNEPLINSFIFNIETADIDADGDMDAAIYYSNTSPNIDWYKNNGAAVFSFGQNITSTANDVHSMRLADLNGDSLVDFVTAYGQTGELVWMQNLGNGIFGAKNVLKTYPILVRQVAVVDADLDGDIDIFCGHFTQGLFYWENKTVSFGLPEIEFATKLYPNPAKNRVVIDCLAGGSYSILNMLGQNVASNMPLQQGENTIALNLKNGTYIFCWMEGDKSCRQLLVIAD